MPGHHQRLQGDRRARAGARRDPADGAVIVEDLLSPDVVDRVNDEVEAAVAAADPDERCSTRSCRRSTARARTGRRDARHLAARSRST